MRNAIALSGAIIEEVNGSSMRYYSRCDKCMDVPNSTTQTSVPSVGAVLTSTYRCNKCGGSTTIRIKGI
jgi:C4-type Zn-finger protein